jgi:2-oxoisovalerate dehydrogenase E1 component alpha subunit
MAGILATGARGRFLDDPAIDDTTTDDTTTDDPTRYRLAADLEHWRLKDPIERVKAYLARGDMADQGFFDDLEAESEELAEHLRAACRALPDPAPTSIFDHVYVEPPPTLLAQRDEMAHYLDSFAEEGSR